MMGAPKGTFGKQPVFMSTCTRNSAGAFSSRHSQRRASPMSPGAATDSLSMP